MKIYQRYPAIRYHKTLAPEGREVKNAAAAAELGEGWVRTPAAFVDGYVEQPELDEGAPLDDVVTAGKEYIPYPAMRYARDGRECVVKTLEEDHDLDPAIWKHTPDPAAWGDAPALPPPDPAVVATAAASQIAASLYYLNAAESTALVNGADTEEKLAAIETAEKAHPKFEGGRTSVLRAIEERREALTAVPA